VPSTRSSRRGPPQHPSPPTRVCFRGNRAHRGKDRRRTVCRRGGAPRSSVLQPLPPPIRCRDGHAHAHVCSVASPPLRVVTFDARSDADKRSARYGFRGLGSPVQDCPLDVRPAAVGPADERAVIRTNARGRRVPPGLKHRSAPLRRTRSPNHQFCCRDCVRRTAVIRSRRTSDCWRTERIFLA
jgi:hypothetical protein